MFLKLKTKKSALVSEGTHRAVVNSVVGKPTEEDPKRIDLGFRVEGSTDEVIKVLPISLEVGSPLRNDVETILGRTLTNQDLSDGFDPHTQLQGKSCQIVVMHKNGSGGRPVAVATLVLPTADAVVAQ